MQSKKDITFETIENIPLNDSISLLKLKPLHSVTLPEIFPGQFVNLRIEAPEVFLRRPISICNYNPVNNELWLMVKDLGKGSHKLCVSEVGETYQILLPLGKGFSLPKPEEKNILLVGGGVGIAPLYLLAQWLKILDREATMLIGARSANDVTFLKEFSKIAKIAVSTDDGSLGEKGLVTSNSMFTQHWDVIYSCGPLPMMKAVASIAKSSGIRCEVSLENHMACGIGACLCCVEDTKNGNVCVCTEGPVFDINELKW